MRGWYEMKTITRWEKVGLGEARAELTEMALSSDTWKLYAITAC